MNLEQANAISLAMSAVADMEVAYKVAIAGGRNLTEQVAAAHAHLDVVTELAKQELPSNPKSPVDADGQRLCELCLLVAVKGTYRRCYACQHNPTRTPGVCVKCGQGAKYEFAVCYACKNGGAPSQATGHRFGYHTTPEPATAAVAAEDDEDMPF